MTGGLDLVWLAGFVDGEGSFYVTKRTRNGHTHFAPAVTVSGTHLETLEFVHSLLSPYGAHLVNKKGRTSKPCYAVVVCNWEGCLAVSAMLLPFLRTKRAHATKLVEWGRHRVSLRDQHGGKYNAPFSESEHVFYDELKRLNRKGVPLKVGGE
jgi:hypothetical protein